MRVQNRVAKPFLVKFPHFRISKGSINDEMIKNKMSGYSGYSADILPDEMKSEDIRVIREEDKSRENNIEITEEEKTLLIVIFKIGKTGDPTAVPFLQKAAVMESPSAILNRAAEWTLEEIRKRDE